MDRIGSINEALAQVSMALEAIDRRASRIVAETREARMREEGYQDTLDVLRQLNKSSISTILFVEHYYIASELEQTKNPDKEASLLKAVEQIQAAREMLPLVKDPVEYKKMIKFLPPQEKEKDLPKDTVVRFFHSHKTRLKNFITYASNDSEGQQAILNQRLLNIKKAEELYVQVQREILGDEWREPTDRSKPTLDPAPTNGSQDMTTEEMKKQIADYEAQRIAYAKKRIEGLPQSLQYGYARKAKEDFDAQHAEEAASIAEMRKIVAEREPKQPKVRKHRKHDDLER